MTAANNVLAEFKIVITLWLIYRQINKKLKHIIVIKLIY